MDLVKDFERFIKPVLECCEGVVEAYPPLLRDRGLEYMRKLNLLRDSERRSGFSYLMPFWFMESFGISEEECHTMAVGNVFALLYFMTQDDIYDSSLDDNKLELLPVSNLFYIEFVGQYRKLFSSDSSFWCYFDRYIREWAESIAWEHSHTKGQAHCYSDEDFIRLSRKAAPLKIPYAAVCLLSWNISCIDSFAAMMDYDQAGFQMIDDWRDWKKDIGEKNYTYLLVEAMKYNKLSSPMELDESHVKKAVYVGNVLEEVIGKASSFFEKARKAITNIDAPYMHLYLDAEMDICRSIISKVQEEKQSMLGGGLSSLLLRLSQNQSE